MLTFAVHVIRDKEGVKLRLSNIDTQDQFESASKTMQIYYAMATIAVTCATSTPQTAVEIIDRYGTDEFKVMLQGLAEEFDEYLSSDLPDTLDFNTIIEEIRKDDETTSNQE
jgi:hypothetical protein